MNTTFERLTRLAALLTATLLLAGCAAPTPTPNAAPIPAPVLRGLRQLSDYPLYELTYEGSYGFAEYLESGFHPTPAPEAAGEPGFACSCFAALGDENQRLLGRNFDWYEHPALVLFTDPPDGYASISMVDLHYLGYDADHTPLQDPSALLQAPYLPFDGMNDQGLAVGMMAVPRAEGMGDPRKVVIEDLEAMRLVLDYAADVPQALDLLGHYNLDFGSVPVHFLLADAGGHSAVVEYLDGAPVVVQNNLPWQVSTNFLVSEEKPQGAASSCWRYNRLYSRLEASAGRLDPAGGMALLQEVSQAEGSPTRWSMVYDLTRRRASLVIDRQYTRVYEFSLQP